MYVHVMVRPRKESLTFRDVLLQVREAVVQKLLLMTGNLADGVDLLDAIRSELDLGREEIDTLVFVQGAVDEGRFDDALLALGGLQQALGEPGSGHGH